MAMKRKVGAVFEAFVFEPDLNSLGPKNGTGKAERPTSWEARSQDVEVELESPASPVAALRVALA